MFDTLPDAPLDLIGDVHGEHDALRALLHHLGYGDDCSHPAGRRPVFVGDLCDRGLDSPGVIRRVMRWVDAGRAQVALGNHELNLLRGQRKEGSDWFHGEDSPRDHKFGRVLRAAEAERQSFLDFFARLPLVLEREDLRVVHAAWHTESIGALRALGDAVPLMQAFSGFEARSEERLKASGLLVQEAAEKQAWRDALVDPDARPPMLQAVAEAGEIRQNGNPIRVATSGLERLADAPFFAGGQWRFAQRLPWWDDYHDVPAVVVGHYWRQAEPVDPGAPAHGDADLFAGIAPTDWHGARRNVFCVDFSAGSRYRDRLAGRQPGHRFRLAALRWPERMLVFDDGTLVPE